MPYRLVWHINDYCNFGCSYCFFPKYYKEDPHVGRLTPQEIYNRLKDTGVNWYLFMAGGEPMLYPRFPELVNLLGPENPIQISTNLYNKNVKAFAEEVDPKAIFLINGSLHILHHNDKSLKKFLENYHMFAEKGFTIAVSYVTYPPLINRMKSDFEFLRREGVKYVLPLTYNGLYDGKQYPGNYTLEQLRTIRDLYQEPLELLVGMEKMKFCGKLCKAGQGYYYMERDGEVYRCATIRKSYGNLFDGTFQLGKEPTPCTAETCHDHVHGMMSVIPEPEPPVLPEPTIWEKTYSLANSLLKPKPKEENGLITMPSKEEREAFIRR